jgi:tetratricopeptide (TPR) repeat protein
VSHRGAGLLVALGAGALLAVGCATSPRADATAVNVTNFPRPEIPAGIAASADLRRSHFDAWEALQAQDVRRASTGFDAILVREPRFYPARTGAAFVLLAGRRFAQAESAFAAVLREEARYLPAVIGRGDALVALGRYVEALGVYEHAVAIDPRTADTRTRLESARIRATQRLVESAAHAREAGRLAEAESALEHAVALAPSSTSLLKEVVTVEIIAGHFDEAEAHVRRAITLEPTDGQWQALLGDVLERRHRYREAAAAYAHAATLDARPEWRARALDLRERAEAALLPSTFDRLTTATQLTRAEVAAFVAIHLDRVVLAAPRRVTDVAVDVRSHWGATWIVPVTRAGIMPIQPNHTFQPDATVTRVELAEVAAALVGFAMPARSTDLARWRAARPVFADLPAGHVAYRAASLAVSSGTMAVDADGRFSPARAATGRELDVLVERVTGLASR